MKKRNKKIILIFILLGLMVGFSYFLKDDPEELSYQKEISLKIGDFVPSEIEYQFNKKDFKGTINWSNLELEENRIYHAGSYQGTVLIHEKEYEILLTVIDDVAPTIDGVTNITIYEQDQIDLLKDIVVTDNSHDEVTIEVKGEYDCSKKGEYSLMYEAKDVSGNIEKKEFILTVEEKEVPKIETPIVVPPVATPVTPTLPDGIVGTTSKGYSIERRNGRYYINNILIANKSYALPSSYQPGGLLGELTSAFEQLKAGAAQDDIDLRIVSGYRSYDLQRDIYNGYVRRDGQAEADTYSARPGHSEHQTGLAIDVNSLDFDFGLTPEGQWLKHHCYQYGFIIRYPEGKESITGYRYEPWHLRYVGELAEELYNDGDWITLEEYFGITSQY